MILKNFSAPTPRLNWRWLGRVCVALGWGAVLFETSAATQLSIRRIADLNPGSNGSFPSNLTVFGSAAYFSAYTTDTGRELWKYDGTGITLVSNINDTVLDVGFGVLVGNDSAPDYDNGARGWSRPPGAGLER